MQRKIIIRVLIALFAILGIVFTIFIINQNKEAEVKELCDRNFEKEISLSAYDTVDLDTNGEEREVYIYKFSAKNICTLGEALDYINSIDDTKPFGLGNKSTYGRPLIRIKDVIADYNAMINRAYWNSSSSTHKACVGQKPIGGFPGSENTCQLGLDNLILENQKYNEFTWRKRAL